MSEQTSDAKLPGVWMRKLPKKVGAVTFMHNILSDNILTRFEFEFIVVFPITLFINLRYREFYEGSEVPEHLDCFEPIYGYSVNLLLRKATEGGEFKCAKSLLKSSRLHIFNGTRHLHSVSHISKGSRKSLIGSVQFAPWPAPMARRSKTKMQPKPDVPGLG